MVFPLDRVSIGRPDDLNFVWASDTPTPGPEQVTHGLYTQNVFAMEKLFVGEGPW